MIVPVSMAPRVPAQVHGSNSRSGFSPGFPDFEALSWSLVIWPPGRRITLRIDQGLTFHGGLSIHAPVPSPKPAQRRTQNGSQTHDRMDGHSDVAVLCFCSLCFATASTDSTGTTGGAATDEAALRGADSDSGSPCCGTGETKRSRCHRHAAKHGLGHGSAEGNSRGKAGGAGRQANTG